MHAEMHDADLQIPQRMLHTNTHSKFTSFLVNGRAQTRLVKVAQPLIPDTGVTYGIMRCGANLTCIETEQIVSVLSTFTMHVHNLAPRAQQTQLR